MAVPVEGGYAHPAASRPFAFSDHESGVLSKVGNSPPPSNAGSVGRLRAVPESMPVVGVRLVPRPFASRARAQSPSVP